VHTSIQVDDPRNLVEVEEQVTMRHGRVSMGT